MFQANVLNIMIAGPSDVLPEVECVKSAIYEWNEMNASTYNLMLRPIHWSTSSFPSISSGDGQAAINKQLVETSDVLICLFGQRLGSPTPRFKSGTVEEIELHRKSGKEVMIFFKESIDSNCDIKQFEALREFRSYLEKEGLLGSYKNIDCLKEEVQHRLILFINHFVGTLQLPLSQLEDTLRRIRRDKQSESEIGTHNRERYPKQDKTTSLFSEEEEKILRLWCASDKNFYNKINFEGGGCVYILGGSQYQVTSGRDIAQWSKFIKKLLEQELIEFTGQYTSQREPLYRLTGKAYDIYS